MLPVLQFCSGSVMLTVSSCRYDHSNETFVKHFPVSEVWRYRYVCQYCISILMSVFLQVFVRYSCEFLLYCVTVMFTFMLTRC